MRATFVDAAIERYLPGVEQFVGLGAGYDTRTVQLQHSRRICCFEVDLPKTQQMKRGLLLQCGVEACGLSLREQPDWGRETKCKRSRGGLAAAVLAGLACRA